MITEIVAPVMTKQEANEWEIEIGKSVNQLRTLLASGYERQAWLALGYSNWTECLETLSNKYGFSERHAWRLHAANETQKLLTNWSVGDIPESQLRPLAGLVPEMQVQVWQEAIQTAPEGKITAVHVQEVVEKYKPHVSQNTGENEWYTPPEYIAAARGVMGRIDLDPASSEIANKTVKATRFYSKQDNGLDKFWAGKVWLNPPYASELIRQFIGKFSKHVISGDISEAIVLVNNATETEWFNDLVSVASAVVFPNGRVRFLDPQGNPGAPLQGQAVVYIGGNPDKFIAEFEDFGWGAKLC